MTQAKIPFSMILPWEYKKEKKKEFLTKFFFFYKKKMKTKTKQNSKNSIQFLIKNKKIKQYLLHWGEKIHN